MIYQTHSNSNSDLTRTELAISSATLAIRTLNEELNVINSDNPAYLHLASAHLHISSGLQLIQEVHSSKVPAHLQFQAD